MIPLLPFFILVRVYGRLRKNILLIKTNLYLIEEELFRLTGEIKKIKTREFWEYAKSVQTHPLTIDLDLCNKHGLFGYLDTTVSEQGFDNFIQMILENKDVEIQKRQKEIRLLVNQKSKTYIFLKHLRNVDVEPQSKVFIPTIKDDIHFWDSRFRKILYYVFPILGIVTPVYGSIALLFDLPFLPILLFINGLILLSYRKDSLRVWKEIGKLSFISNRFRKFFIYTSDNKKVSKKILRTISKLGDSFEILISPLPHIILNILLFWDLWKIRRFTQWVSLYKSTWNQWTQNLIEYDSLLPFANFSFLHSEFGFPSLNDENVISAESLVHPLLPKKNRVENPVFPVKKGDLVVITGSNMSGKTTYLRSVAVSLLLARAGAKVAGKGFQFPNFTIHTLIRSQDSLEDGVSFFYSEVRRLAEILKNADSEKQIPILFLDEILKGTNSKERYIATRELLFALKEKGAIVFVTTHDLKLSEIPWAQQFHFTELEVDGNMEFDYKIRKGVSTSTNALRILKKEGIPIRNEEE